VSKKAALALVYKPQGAYVELVSQTQISNPYLCYPMQLSRKKSCNALI